MKNTRRSADRVNCKNGKKIFCIKSRFLETHKIYFPDHRRARPNQKNEIHTTRGDRGRVVFCIFGRGPVDGPPSLDLQKESIAKLL